MHWTRIVTGGVVALGLLGCTEDVGGRVARDSGSWSQMFATASQGDSTFLYVVDPADTELAADIRSASELLVPHQLREWDPRKYQRDPGAWVPLHVTAAVIDPTAQGSARWGEPITLHTDRLTDERMAVFGEAVAAEILGVADAGGTYAPADAAADVLSGLFGQRAAADLREAAWLEAFEPGDALPGYHLTALTSRPGALPTRSWDHAAVIRSQQALVTTTIVAPSPAETCSYPVPLDWAELDPEPTGLIEVLTSTSSEEPTAVPWPCAQASLQPWSIASRSWCTSSPIRRRDDGSVACKVWALDLDEDTACVDQGRGWIEPDPDDVASVRRSQSWATGRLCEIPQLEGEARATCEVDPMCEGCGDGFCRSNLDLHHDGDCPSGHPTQLRFVGRSTVGGGRFYVACALEE